MKYIKIIFYSTLPLSFLFMIYGVVSIVEKNVSLFYIGFILIIINLLAYLKWLCESFIIIKEYKK